MARPSASHAGTWVDQRLGRQRLDEWFEEWWATRTELRPSTIARDESLYRNHVLPRFGDLPLACIDYQLVTAWVVSLGIEVWHQQQSAVATSMATR